MISLIVFGFLSFIFVFFNNTESNNIKKENQIVDFTQLSYVAFGDSITMGVDGLNGGVMEKPYPTLVSESLNFKSYKNLAISGSTFCSNSGRTNMTQRVLSYTDEADILSLMLGVNDYCLSLPLGTPNDKDNSTIYGSLHLIAKHWNKNYNDSFCFFMTPFQKKNGTVVNSQGYTLKDVADAVKYVGYKFDIPVLDIYELGKYEVEMNLSGSDGLHPSQMIMKQYASPRIVEFIKNNYK